MIHFQCPACDQRIKALEEGVQIKPASFFPTTDGFEQLDLIGATLADHLRQAEGIRDGWIWKKYATLVGLGILVLVEVIFFALMWGTYGVPKSMRPAAPDTKITRPARPGIRPEKPPKPPPPPKHLPPRPHRNPPAMRMGNDKIIHRNFQPRDPRPLALGTSTGLRVAGVAVHNS